MIKDSDSAIAALTEILRDQSSSRPAAAADSAEADALFECARHHGVHLLIAHYLRQTGSAACSADLRERLSAATRRESVIERVRRVEVEATIAALHGAGVPPLVFKGAALAFTHYPDPYLRPHVDVDLLVEPGQVDAAAVELARLGYRRLPFVTGSLVTQQIPWRKVDRYGIEHIVDLHWKISNPHVFSNLFSHAELMPRAISIPALGVSARGLSAVDALAVACIHRVAHHYGRDRLIWLYDIHLIAGGLSASQADQFARLSRAKRIGAVCGEGLALARAAFGTSLHASLVDLIDKAPAADEPSTGYLRSGVRKVDVLLSDLKALDNWRDRARLLKEHLFPSAAYMEQAYGVSNRLLLPAYYARRFAEGAGGWFERPAEGPPRPTGR